jgi:hypothetical protein
LNQRSRVALRVTSAMAERSVVPLLRIRAPLREVKAARRSAASESKPESR